MRGTTPLLVLLLSMYGALTLSTEVQTESQSQNIGAAAAAAEASTQLDVSAELKELRDMVVEVRVTLKYTQDELKAMEAENAAVKERLVVSETKVEALERALQDTKAEMKREVTNLERALKDTEAEMMTKIENLRKENAVIETIVEALKNDNAAQKQEMAALRTRLSASETQIVNQMVQNTEQKAELTEIKTKLVAAETSIENLEKESQAASKVAFSASLTNSGYIQSGNSNDSNLVFSKIITNVGQAYSSKSGIFTAPIKGVYYFRFTVMDLLSSTGMSVRMCKNGQQVLRQWEYDTDGKETYLSSGVTLQLEVGDEVNLVLPAGYRLYDNKSNYNIFSGFLLFSL